MYSTLTHGFSQQFSQQFANTVSCSAQNHHSAVLGTPKSFARRSEANLVYCMVCKLWTLPVARK